MKRVDNVEREFQSMNFSLLKRARLKRISIVTASQDVHNNQFNVLKSKQVIQSTSLSKASNEEKKTCETKKISTRSKWLRILLSYNDRVLFMTIMQKSRVILNQSRHAVEQQDRINHDQFFDRVQHRRISKENEFIKSKNSKTLVWQSSSWVNHYIELFRFAQHLVFEKFTREFSWFDETRSRNDKKNEKMTSSNDRSLLWSRVKKR